MATERKTGRAGHDAPSTGSLTTRKEAAMTSTKTDLFGHYKALVADVAATDDTAYAAATQTYVAADSGDKARMRAYVTKTGQAEMVALDVTDEAAVARVKALIGLGKAQSDAVGTA